MNVKKVLERVINCIDCERLILEINHVIKYFEELEHAREAADEIRELHEKINWLNNLLTKSKIENRNLEIEIKELRNQLFKNEN